MIELGQHWVFIDSAYAGCFVLIAALIFWVAADAYRARARVEALEAARERQRAGGD